MESRSLVVFGTTRGVGARAGSARLGFGLASRRSEPTHGARSANGDLRSCPRGGTRGRVTRSRRARAAGTRVVVRAREGRRPDPRAMRSGAQEFVVAGDNEGLRAGARRTQAAPRAAAARHQVKAVFAAKGGSARRRSRRTSPRARRPRWATRLPRRPEPQLGDVASLLDLEPAYIDVADVIA